MSHVALYQALKAANVPDDLAARAVESLPPDAGNVATKADIADLRTEIERIHTKIATQTWQLLGGVALLLTLFEGISKYIRP